MENITNLIINLTAMVTAIAAAYVAWQKVKTDVKSAVPKKIKGQVAVDSEITNKLENLKEYLNADRVQIYDFHNGRALCKWSQCPENKLFLRGSSNRYKRTSKRAAGSTFILHTTLCRKAIK